jgi:hypothetical protein
MVSLGMGRGLSQALRPPIDELDLVHTGVEIRDTREVRIVTTDVRAREESAHEEQDADRDEGHATA